MRLALALLLATACSGASNDGETAGETDTVTCTDEDGVVREVGETWDAGDCGNTCSCEAEGYASCTELGCP